MALIEQYIGFWSGGTDGEPGALVDGMLDSEIGLPLKNDLADVEEPLVLEEELKGQMDDIKDIT